MRFTIKLSLELNVEQIKEEVMKEQKTLSQIAMVIHQKRLLLFQVK